MGVICPHPTDKTGFELYLSIAGVEVVPQSKTLTVMFMKTSHLQTLCGVLTLHRNENKQ